MKDLGGRRIVVTGGAGLIGSFLSTKLVDASHDVLSVNSRSRIVHLRLLPDDPVQRRPVITKAEETWASAPKIGLDEGLTRTVPYLENYLRRYQT
jgi:UDP-glucuronate decarboxylase